MIGYDIFVAKSRSYSYALVVIVSSRHIWSAGCCCGRSPSSTM
jgi:hypothetical protein